MEHGTDSVIKIEHLCKSFGDLKAVDDLSFQVRKGELFAFLGVNGAGKSTTISIMCGMLKKDSGKVFIDNRDVDSDLRDIAKSIGVVFQNSVLDSALSVRENLYTKAGLYGLFGKERDKVIDRLASELDFKKLMKRKVGKLSGGQRRKIDVARALLSSPKILILDEPTTGLDPQTRKTLWNVIDDYRKNQGMTVLLTTHYMEEAADADYVVILDSGKISAEGTPLMLKNRYTGDFITLYHADEEEVKKLGLVYELLPDAIRIEVKDTEEAKKLIVRYPDLFVDFEIVKGKMDDVFLSVTGKKLTGGEK